MNDGRKALSLYSVPPIATKRLSVDGRGRVDRDKPLAPMSWPLPHFLVLRGTLRVIA